MPNLGGVGVGMVGMGMGGLGGLGGGMMANTMIGTHNGLDIGMGMMGLNDGTGANTTGNTATNGRTSNGTNGVAAGASAGGTSLGLITTAPPADPETVAIQRRTEEIIAFSARGMGSAAGAGEGGR